MMLALDAKASEKEAEETVPGLTRDEHAEELQDEAAHADTVYATSSGDAVKEEQETDELTAGVEFVSDTTFATNLAFDGVKVGTVEHLLATLA
ncbi:MAG: UDP-3-O-acyl-N-acetylglucosamine deacetylase, partial [Candidatus Mariimomonas ferrooxydans]